MQRREAPSKGSVNGHEVRVTRLSNALKIKGFVHRELGQGLSQTPTGMKKPLRSRHAANIP